jgi:ABC-type amino acid transport substrate-binding protein
MKILFLTFVVVLSTTSLYAQNLNDLVFITEEYPPFNFTAEGRTQGISTDILLEMLKLAGASQTREDIGSLPWARGYNVALTTEDVLLYSTTRTAARENLFKWVGPIIRSKIVLFARKDRNLALSSIDDINQMKLRVGVVLNDVGEQTLLELGVKRNGIYRFNKGIHLAEMLEKGRIDLLAYGNLVTLWNLKSLGFNPSDYEAIYTLKEAEYYYALNRKTDDQIINQLQKALDHLKESGRVAAIIKGYLD